MDLPSHSQSVVLRPPTLFVPAVALSGCAGTQPSPSHHAAHGHAIATIERAKGDAEVMLERVEDEDTIHNECARLAIWDTDFPAFDGADMVVSYSLDID